jgi:DNA repair exonuclease SbcCD ATPase subunit
MIAELRTKADKATARHEAALANGLREGNLALEAGENLDAAKQARELSQSIAQEVQLRAYKAVASVVSRCLETVFDEPYTFKMDFVQRRGRTEVVLAFERDGVELDPMTASGGGVVDVASFALRMAAILISKSQGRRMLVLDEPFKFVSEQYRPMIRELLEVLSKELGVQILMVTHMNELRIGEVIEL